MSDDEVFALSRRQLIQASAASLVAPTGGLPAAALAAAPEPTRQGGTTTAARYILTRLADLGVKVLFGVPGATCDPLFAVANRSGLSVVVTSSDLEAGYAADGYARLGGLGAVTVTYGVGTLSLISVIAGAYAERSPVVVINGGPSAEDLRIQRELGSLHTHSTGRENSDLAMFREVTAYAERAERASDVPRIVDAALRTAFIEQRPVYIEVAKDLWEASCPAPDTAIDTSIPPSGQEGRLAGEILERLRSASRPALLLGIELQRYGLAGEAAALVKKLGLPWATTLLAKSVIPEQTHGFAGVYNGEKAVPSVKTLIEDSDALLLLGCVLSRQHRRLATRSSATMVLAADHAVRFGRKPAVKAELRPLLAELQRQPWKPDPAHANRGKLAGLSFDQRRASMPPGSPSPDAGKRGLSYDDALREVSDFLDESFLTITDTSLSMYPAAELNIAGRAGFLCNAVWQAIGYSVGAAVGAAFAQPRRPLVVCGDGGFQMTAQSLSTMARHQVRAIVIVLDNGAYAIEQYILDPSFFRNASTPLRPYLALNRWSYPDLARSMGFKVAKTVDTPAALKQALGEAKLAEGPVLISVNLRQRDLPAALKT